MKVYLVRTPEYEQEKFNSVYEFLDSVKGEIKFFKEDSPIEEKAMLIMEEVTSEVLFSFCKTYRKNSSNKIKDKDFIILLTKIKNTEEWFSKFEADKNNIYIYTDEWEQYTEGANPLYPIAHQVVENIIQSLMGLDVEHDVHRKPTPCINDFCDNKKEFIHKFLTVRAFCRTCKERIKSTVNGLIIVQVEETFKKILEHINLEEQVKNSPVFVDTNGNITLVDYNLEFELDPICKTIYLFFLARPNGIREAELYKYENEIRAIYMRIKPNTGNEEAQKTIRELTRPKDNNYRSNKSRLNRKIQNIFRIHNLPFNSYLIPKKDNLDIVKINIDSTLITNHFVM